MLTKKQTSLGYGGRTRGKFKPGTTPEQKCEEDVGSALSEQHLPKIGGSSLPRVNPVILACSLAAIIRSGSAKLSALSALSARTSIAVGMLGLKAQQQDA